MGKYTFKHASVLTDQEITSIFTQVIDEGLYDRFWFNNQCTSALEFLNYARSVGTWFFLVYRGERCAGFGVCDDRNGEAMRFHHCQFVWAWRYTGETAKHVLDWLKWALAGVRTLIGITPDVNIAAVRYAERSGFTVLGTIPNAVKTSSGQCGAVISYYQLHE